MNVVDPKRQCEGQTDDPVGELIYANFVQDVRRKSAST
jgi:hypothetical protein